MATKTQSLAITVGVGPRTLIAYTVLLIIAVFVAFCLLYRLGAYPAAWTDEGAHLQIAKNYALNGIYGEISSEGPRFSGGVVGTGPTVLLPIALLYKLFGVSISLGRVFIVATSIGCLIVLFLLANRVADQRTAALATALVFLSPSIAFVQLSRTVIGEVPGLLFLVGAFWLWFRSDQPSLRELIAAGVLFGLAAITKNQYALFILPSLLACFLAELFYYRRRGWLFFVVPGVVAGGLFFGWTYYVLFILGSRGSDLNTLQATSASAFFIIQDTTLERALRLLMNSSLYAAITIPTLLYGALLSLRRTNEGQRWGILYIFIVIALVEFVLSLAWGRYGFAPLVLLAIFVARLMSDLSQGFQINTSALRGVLRGEEAPLSLITSVIVVGFMGLLIVWPISNVLHDVTTWGNSDAYRLANYLNENVPKEALIETWELELAVVSDHTYHFPPQNVMTTLVAHENLGGQAPDTVYDFRDFGTPEYVIVGDFGYRGEIYLEDRLTDYEWINNIGDYDIWKRK